MFYWVLLGFHWVLLGFTRFYWVLLGFTGFNFLPHFRNVDSSPVPRNFTLKWALLGYTELYWLLPGLSLVSFCASTLCEWSSAVCGVR